MATDIPAYLKFTNFKITNSLDGKMPLYSDADKDVFGFITSLVLYDTRKNPAHFANISSKVFKAKNRHYRRYMDMLVQMGELEVNERYIFSEGMSYTKSYRIPAAALASGTTTFSVKRKRIKASKDTTTPTTKGIIHQQKCFRELGVRRDFISTGEVGKDNKARCALLKVQQGCANIRKGRKTNRQYNTILQIPAAARCNLEHKEGYQLAEFDFGTCHPFLLLEYCTPEEKAKYADFITGQDVYSYVIEQTGKKIDRDKAKKYFLKFLNGGRKNLYDDFFKANFPQLHSFVRAGGKANAVTFQNLEASIMENLETYCAEQNLFFIRQHDGWMGKVNEGKTISDKLIQIVTSRVGVRPTIKVQSLLPTTPLDSITTIKTKECNAVSILVHKELPVQPITNALPTLGEQAEDMRRTIQEFKRQTVQKIDILGNWIGSCRKTKIPEYRNRSGKVLPYGVRAAIYEKQRQKYDNLHAILNSQPNLNSN